MAASKHGLEVIYGDTDSIMLNSRTKDLKEAEAKAQAVKKTVNKDMKYKGKAFSQ